MNSEEYRLEKVNTRKLIRMVRGSIKKAFFYLGARVPYSLSEELILVRQSNIVDYYAKAGEGIKRLIDIDAKIRFCDDTLDDKLGRMVPKPIKKMRKLVERFRRDVPEAERVADLFDLELDIMSDKMARKEIKDIIREIIEIRPGDFFVIIEVILDIWGCDLSKKDLGLAWNFLKEFQRLRDMLDDMMSIEEDLANRDYNSVVYAKRAGIDSDFFEKIAEDKFVVLESVSGQIKEHPHPNIFCDTIDFWKKQYKLLFHRLLLDYYSDESEFRKSYFMIKQL